MKEKWRRIADCPKYAVSDGGRVKNIKTGRILWVDVRVVLRVDGKSICRPVARLVAAAFIPNPENLQNVTHINGDQTDNRVRNLRWCSKSEITAAVHAKKAKNKKI